MTPPTSPDPSGRRTKRPGSRLALALALAAAVPSGMFGGALLADALSSLLGIDSALIRLALKVLLMAAALPAAFYVVERLFLSRASRRRRQEDPGRS